MSPGSKELQPLKSQKRIRLDPSHLEETQQRTEEALKELFHHVHNMPDSAKKKKLIRQVVFREHTAGCTRTAAGRAVPQSHLQILSRLTGAGATWELWGRCGLELSREVGGVVTGR